MSRIIVVLCLVAFGYYLLTAAQRLVATPGAVLGKAEERQVTMAAVANGVIEARTQARVAPTISGEIVWMQAEEGDVVREGQAVARLDAQTIQAQVGQVKASIAVAQANLQRTRSGSRRQEVEQAQAAADKARVVMDEKKADLDRTTKLHEGRAAPLRDLESARTAFLAARADHERALAQVALLEEGPRSDDVEIARRRLDEARAQLRSLEVQLSKTEIRSPIRGTVVRKLAHRGEVVMPGQALVHVVDMATVEAVLNVEELTVDAVRVGSAVEVTVDALPERPLVGRVTYIAPVSSEQLKISLLKEEEDVKRFHVKVALDGSTGRIRSGMSVKGKFSIERRGVFVPREAVHMRGGTPVVRVVAGGRLVERVVRAGVEHDDWVQVVDGLVGGESILVRGVLRRE